GRRIPRRTSWRSGRAWWFPRAQRGHSRAVVPPARPRRGGSPGPSFRPRLPPAATLSAADVLRACAPTKLRDLVHANLIPQMVAAITVGGAHLGRTAVARAGER